MSAAAESIAQRRRVRARVDGVVQGVGFRPHAYRLAVELRLGGFVLNDPRGVALEVEGPPDRIETFFERLVAEQPPLAAIEAVHTEHAVATGEREFRIVESDGGEGPDAPVAADTATCEDCLAELFDPTDRRHRYPFINCTNCGPRFSIVRGVPYDRPLTTMAGFEMCDALPGRVRGSRSTAVSTPSRTLVRTAGRGRVWSTGGVRRRRPGSTRSTPPR